MRDTPNWILWRLENRKDKHGGKEKPTKTPYSVHGGYGKTNDPKTWTSFDNALTALEKGKYSGIGFVFTGTPFIAVDIDHCHDPETKEFTQLARDIANKLSSYTELSQSKSGLHVIVKGKLPDGRRRNDKLGIEMYGDGSPRYFAMTGLCAGDTAIRECQADIDAVHAEYIQGGKSPQEPRQQAATCADNLLDHELLTKARKAKNGGTFAALYDSGDVSAYDGDESGADQALCNLLAFWTSRNAARMDALFRRSALMRDKWDERRGATTYGAMTIQRAIDDCRNVYDQYPPEQSRVEREKSYKPTDFTDTGNAYIFAREYDGKAIYVKSIGWLVWNGKVWDEGELEAAGLAMQLTDNMLVEARAELKRAGDAVTAAQVSEDDEAKKKANEKMSLAREYRNHAKKSREQPKIAAMLKLARTLLQVKPEKLDADPHILNTPAGMVDLRTGAMKPHGPAQLCTKITGVSPGTKGADMWNSFLYTITQGDGKLEAFLQQVAGMATVGRVYAENLIIAIGDGGNGKSALFNTWMIVMHTYAGTIAAEVLTTSNRSKGAELATLKGKRLIIAAETDEGARLDVSMLKQLTSTDKIHAERKYKDPEDFDPSHTTILYTNHLPRVGSTDNGTWRRIIAIPFRAKIPARTEVKNYAETLSREAGEAVMSWIIEGAINFCRDGYKLTIPNVVAEAVEEYQTANDWMTEFLNEFCEVGQGRSVKAGLLYKTYHEWASIAHGYARKSDAFGAELQKRGFENRKTKSGSMWYGLNFTPQECVYYPSYGSG